MYDATSGPSVKPMIPEIPHPSSRTSEWLSRIPCLKSRFDEEAIHDANRGVIFQTTEHFSHADDASSRYNLPAPVVPPSRFDDKIVGD
jgi:hypothetical protein